MPVDQIKTSEAFRRTTFRACLAIIFFLFIYLLLISASIALIALCGVASYAMLTTRVNVLTAGLSVGLICMGFFVFYFLIKFIFQKHIVDRSGLQEITEKDHPELFALIREIVAEAHTNFPKKIFLSPEVNASVFYDSGFWSMFLPIPKNLQIGMGLVNTLTVAEFKAVLAHEFGHFSQRSMKVGSYVYNVNYVIYNMLYDNNSFEATLEKWAAASSYLSIAASLAAWIVRGIQWVLKKAYDVVNLSYMSLSREMEFHADEVAANIAGSQPLVNALRRFELADYAYNVVVGYYHEHSAQSVRSENLYEHQSTVLTFLGQQNKLAFENGLPQANAEQNRYNKSKLVISDQWASHPSDQDRIERLNALNLTSRSNDSRRATELFHAPAKAQQVVSDHLFSLFDYPTAPIVKSNADFERDFRKSHRERSFDDLYNGYYDNKDPQYSVLADEPTNATEASELFGHEALDLVYSAAALENDIQLLEAISNGSYQIKTFDYDGNKYSARDAALLVPDLKNELAGAREDITVQDFKIGQFFLEAARQQQQEAALQALIGAFTETKTLNERYDAVCSVMVAQTQFLTVTTPFAQIEENFASLKETEGTLKQNLSELLENALYKPQISSEMQEGFTKYISEDWVYFTNPSYHNESLQILFETINQYSRLLSQTIFVHKKRLLDFQAGLISVHQPLNSAS